MLHEIGVLSEAVEMYHQESMKQRQSERQNYRRILGKVRNFKEDRRNVAEVEGIIENLLKELANEEEEASEYLTEEESEKIDPSQRPEKREENTKPFLKFLL